MRAGIAGGPARPTEKPPTWVVALFAASFAVVGAVQAVYAFAGEATYADLARGRGQVTFVTPSASWTLDDIGLVALHRQTLAYVLDAAPEPATMRDGRPLFDANERAHLADVRAVFRAVRIAWIIAALVLAALVVRGGMRRYALRTIRSGAIWAAGAVLLIGLVFAVAFEPAFLAFHYVFFPQGNFLFDPATSNLLRLYPEAYWYGVTLRIALAFIVVSALAAFAATAALRARAAR